MPVVIFVHGIGGRSQNYGIGGRKQDYIKTLKEIEEKIEIYNKKDDLGFNFVSCLWGDECGAKLQEEGVSIPDYEDTGGTEALNSTQRDIFKWIMLKDNPLWEIKESAYRGNEEDKEPSSTILKHINNFLERINFFIETSGFSENMEKYEEQINELAKELNISLNEYIEETNSLIAKLNDECGIDTLLLQYACELVIDSPVYERWLETVRKPLENEYSEFVRAILAQSIFYLNQANVPAPILRDTEKRDEILDYIVKILGRTRSRAGESDWLKKCIDFAFTSIRTLPIIIGVQIAEKPLIDIKRKRRGAITDSTYPMAGDILVYQYAEGGKRIREEIKKQIDKYKDQEVILLAHSLGGVACVDLLIENLEEGRKLPVKALITVGSQAPFFYEINALQSFPYEKGKRLPSGFPKWLNIYDLNDFLSYIGKNLFPGQITDEPVVNQLPVIGTHLVESHTGYWKNQKTWDIISKFWTSIKKQEVKGEEQKENEPIES